jgi:hypothetical protein
MQNSLTPPASAGDHPAMKLTTQRDLIRSVATRWRQQYEPFTHDTPLFSVRNGHRQVIPKKEIAASLEALDKETATAADVAAIIGNESWTRLTCDECGKDTDAVIMVGQEPDYESHTASLCRSCVERASSIPCNVERIRAEINL